MAARMVKIERLLVDADELLQATDKLKAVNDCFFVNWDCQDKTLRRRALDMIARLEVLDNELLIRKEDYVNFEHVLNEGCEYTRIAVLREKNGVSKVIGSFHFTLRTDNNIAAFCSGDYNYIEDEKPSDLKAFSCWKHLQKAARGDYKTRADMRNIFM